MSVAVGIPVVILGGFLGAGKTTALNHMLRHAQKRIGVLVNDFGAVNVDAALIEAREGDLVALSNGCVCCSIGPDLGQSLARVLERAPDRIVVEASGVSDPWRVAQLVKLEPGLVLDAVPVLVDAVSFPDHLADAWLADTLERQLARADLVVLSKCDLADERQRAATRDAVRRLRPGATLLEIAGGALPAVVFGTAPDLQPGRFSAEAPPPGFRSWHWAPPAALNKGKLRAALKALPESVLRAKGICHLGPDAEPHLLQLVGRRWSLEPWIGHAPSGLVLIGTDQLPAPEHLAAHFAGTILAPTTN